MAETTCATKSKMGFGWTTAMWLSMCARAASTIRKAAHRDRRNDQRRTVRRTPALHRAANRGTDPKRRAAGDEIRSRLDLRESRPAGLHRRTRPERGGRATPGPQRKKVGPTPGHTDQATAADAATASGAGQSLCARSTPLKLA